MIEEITRAIQALVGATKDGVYGPQTAKAVYRALSGSEWQEAPAPLDGGVDARSEKNIQTLLPEVQRLARQLVLRAREKGIKAVITSGTRTYEEQDALYEQGRTKPGKIVTNARAGFSNHNYSVAFDVTLFKGNAPIWESPDYAVVGKIGESLGLKWGGRWTSPDEPHFEYNPKGYTVAQMRSLKDSGKSVLA